MFKVPLACRYQVVVDRDGPGRKMGAVSLIVWPRNAVGNRRCPTTCLWWFLGPLRSPGLPSAETALVQKPQYDMCPTVPWYGSGTEDMGADDLSTGVDGGTLGTIRR